MKKIILVLITIIQCSAIFAQEVGNEDRRGTITVFESNTTRKNRAILHADEKGAYLRSTWNTQGTDAISFRNSDNESEMIIDKSGNVGIGTENPKAKLQVNEIRPILFDNNGNNGIWGSEIGFGVKLNTVVVPHKFIKLPNINQRGGAVQVVDYSGNMHFQMSDNPINKAPGSENEEFTIDYSPQITFSNNGNLGIGTSSPEAKLQISSSKSGVAEGLRLHDNGSGASEGLWIQFSQAYMSDMARIGARSVDNKKGSLKFYTKDTNDEKSKERMIINPDGSVKIGGNYTSSLLSLEAIDDSSAQPARSVSLKLRGYGGRAKGIHISDKNTTNNWFIGEGYGYEGIGIGYNSTDSRTEYSENTKFFVGTDGNVGIGTLNSTDGTGTYKLSVKGRVRADEVKVYTGWADFVFDKGYNLPTLKEVENHINAKGHLKDIPSAKEVEKNGINLGEMNSKLLQKIEELTLYTIQQEKRINSLEKSNYELKEQNEELKKNSEDILLIKKEIESLKINK